jgi:predicted Zn-dependent peptidase
MALLGAGLLLAARAAGAADLERFDLPNGMRVVLSRDPAVPVATLAMAFDVGARHEPPGRSGFAHLFEHLMFEGSAHAPKGDFDRLLESCGGENNASTHLDFTFYYESVPSNALPQAAWLDADRLGALDLREESLRNQVSVVSEERRQTLDNKPYRALLDVEIASRAFSRFPNSHPVIGSHSDIDSASLGAARDFFREYYSPKNGWIAVVGDFDPAQARGTIEKYFGWIPNRGEPVFPDTAEPRQEAERRTVVPDAHAKVPGLAVAWSNLPERRSRPDYYALSLLGRALFLGKSSRLYQLLVKERQAASAVDEPYAGGLGFPSADPEEYRAPGLFGGFVLLKSSSSAEQVRGWIFDEVRRIGAGAFTALELDRVKTRFRSDWIAARQSTRGRAMALLRAAVLDGDPAADEEDLQGFMAVTPAEVRAAAARYLVPEAANVFELEAGGL